MHPSAPRHSLHRQRGVAAVEYGLGMMLFFVFMLGVLEVARATFIWNTMVEVNARAARGAAMVNFNDADAKDAVRKQAMFADTLPAAPDIGYANLRIDYLQADGKTAVSPMPSCPALNLANCLAGPTSTSCIRFVRVRLCQADTDCASVTYHPMTGLTGLSMFNFSMPFFTAIVPAESLGMPGACT